MQFTDRTASRQNRADANRSSREGESDNRNLGEVWQIFFTCLSNISGKYAEFQVSYVAEMGLENDHNYFSSNKVGVLTTNFYGRKLQNLRN